MKSTHTREPWNKGKLIGQSRHSRYLDNSTSRFETWRRCLTSQSAARRGDLLNFTDCTRDRLTDRLRACIGALPEQATRVV